MLVYRFEIVDVCLDDSFQMKEGYGREKHMRRIVQHLNQVEVFSDLSVDVLLKPSKSVLVNHPDTCSSPHFEVMKTLNRRLRRQCI